MTGIEKITGRIEADARAEAAQIAAEAKDMLAYKASPALTADWILAKLP